MFLTDTQLVQVVGLLYGEVAKNCMHSHNPYRCKVQQPDALQHNGMTNCNGNVHVEVRSFVKSTWKLLPLKMGRE